MAEENKQATDDEQKSQDLQKKYMEYQMAEQQLKQLHEHSEKLEQQIAEVDQVKTCLTDLQNAKKGDETLVPISNGIFFRAKIEESAKFLVNVGSGVVVEKTVDETKDLIEKQKQEITKYKEGLTEQVVETMMKFQQLELELRDLVE